MFKVFQHKWGRDKMTAILQTTFPNAIVWIRWYFTEVFSCPINNIPALVQIMAWHRPGDKPLFEHWWLLYWRIYASLGRVQKCFWKIDRCAPNQSWNDFFKLCYAVWRPYKRKLNSHEVMYLGHITWEYVLSVCSVLISENVQRICKNSFFFQNDERAAF